MRKKYLSALLFGALLFASAGTFTSCKDYDDDINNLQEQINTINTTLADLKAQIGDKGVSSVTFDESTGVLTVVDADGTKTYTIKTTAGEVADVKITIEGQELKVNGETVGKVGDTVAVANGELTINGTATGIKVGEYSILDNQDAGTVTITLPDADGKLQTVVLAKASSSLTAVQFEDVEPSYFVGWGTAAIAHPNWEGPKGAVERNQFLVGKIGHIDVKVTPANFDLGSADLKLVDSKGNEAPVKVSAKANERLLGRTATTTGSWSLYIEMGDEVNENNIWKVFSYDDEGSSENKVYSLSVNGSPFTIYDLDIKTGKYTNPGAITDRNLCFVDKAGRLQVLGFNTNYNPYQHANLPVDQTTEVFLDNETDLYDSYITFEGTNKSLADKYGIKAEGMKISVPAEATGVTIEATVHTMSVDGTEGKYVVTLKTEAGATASQTINATTHEIKPDASAANILRKIRIDLGSVFENIPATVREAIKIGNQLAVVEEKSQQGFIAASYEDEWIDKDYNVIGQNNVSYLKADGKTWNASIDDLLDLKYLDITVYQNLAWDAKPGSYQLSLVGYDKDLSQYWNGTSGESGNIAGNRILKIDMPVNVTVPAFDAMFEKTAKWSDGTFNARISIDGNNAVLRLGDAFSKTSAYNAEYSHLGFAINNINGVSPITNGTASSTNTQYTLISSQSTAQLNITPGLIYNTSKTALAHSKLENMVAYYTLFDVVDQVASGLNADDLNAVKEAFTVTSTPYTSNIITALEGVQLVNYINSAAQEGITLDADGHINGYTENAQGVGNGLALVLANKWAVIDSNTGTLNNADGAKYTMITGVPSGNNVKMEWNIVDGTTATLDATGLEAAGLTNPSTLKVKLTDGTGFIYTDDIKIEPAR